MGCVLNPHANSRQSRIHTTNRFASVSASQKRRIVQLMVGSYAVEAQSLPVLPGIIPRPPKF